MTHMVVTVNETTQPRCPEHLIIIFSSPTFIFISRDTVSLGNITTSHDEMVPTAEGF